MTYRDMIFLGCGLAIGATASYYVTKRKVEEAMWKDYQEKKKAEKGENEAKSDENASENDPEEPSDHHKTDISVYKPAVTSKDLLAARNESAEISVKSDYIPYLVTGDKSVADAITELPYFISDSEYAADEDHGSAMINYYPHRGVAFDESDNEIGLDDVAVLIGGNNLDTMVYNDVQHAFIRNPVKKMDYVVNICRGNLPTEEGPLPEGE